ncbi:UNVERIFIED_ORG: hypothetical protein ABIC62_006712 [Burkholderia sp. 1595]|uniref:Uncharacterized protein n=1 Tax=Paraburkholderia terricola TaxID=169427 RepID=A0ABU1M2M0_9BURK|nr:hypothetical protein [Paraburkholderia terricola]
MTASSDAASSPGATVQQLTHRSETGAAYRVGERPIVTDPMEAAGEHVEQVAGLQRHRLVARAPFAR